MNTTTETASMTATLTANVVPVGEWFTNLSDDVQADITEMVNEKGYPLSDISDFIEQYGVTAYSEGHYVTWCELTESGHDNDAIEAYVAEVGIYCVGGFEDAYVGEYDSEVDFAQQYFDENYHSVSALEEIGVVIDWQSTWDTNLSYNYGFNNGYVFNTNV
jgi:antirestriction protein